jgi:hypothetical protein
VNGVLWSYPMVEETARICRHVADRGAAILRARRLEDAPPGAPGWSFSCGLPEHAAGDERVCLLEHVLASDPTAVEIVLHPRGTEVGRPSATARWHTEEGPLLFPQRRSRRWPTLDPQYPPRASEPLDAADLSLLADVADRGFHVDAVGARGDDPAHAFTVGLFRSFDHPEVIVFGSDPGDLEAIAEAVGDRVRGGDRFEEGAVATGILPGRPVVFRRVAARHYSTWLAHAAWYHGGLRFPAVQCVWPDAAGNFPWDRWYPRWLRAQQPILDGRELA